MSGLIKKIIIIATILMMIVAIANLASSKKKNAAPTPGYSHSQGPTTSSSGSSIDNSSGSFGAVSDAGTFEPSGVYSDSGWETFVEFDDAWLDDEFDDAWLDDAHWTPFY